MEWIERCHGIYALRFYLPFSALARRWRGFSRGVRGKSAPFHHETRLPEVGWREVVETSARRLREHRKANGNVRISELAILSAIAESCRPASNLFEIGTFDGRTTLNLALNAPVTCRIYTLDLPPEVETRYRLASGERHMVEKPEPGRRYKRHRDSSPAVVGRIHQLHGDSATFDYTPLQASCSLVFVDGSHSYEYARSDTRAAMRLVEPGGMVVWHDYGIWKGVTRVLDERGLRDKLNLRHIRGTSLVVWKKPGAA